MKFYSPFELYFWTGTVPFMLGAVILLACNLAMYTGVWFLVRYLWKASSKLVAIATGIFAFPIIFFGAVDFTQNHNNQSVFVAWLVGAIVIIGSLACGIGWALKRGK